MLTNSEILDILVRVKKDAETLYDSENGVAFNATVTNITNSVDVLNELVKMSK